MSWKGNTANPLITSYVIFSLILTLRGNIKTQKSVEGKLVSHRMVFVFVNKPAFDMAPIAFACHEFSSVAECVRNVHPL